MARTKRKINPVIPPPAVEPAKVRIYRTGGYVRLSVEDSGKPGADTIEAQKAQILSYIEQQPDMTFCGVFCDNGHSGTNFERPAFEQLMNEIRTGKIDCIVKSMYERIICSHKCFYLFYNLRQFSQIFISSCLTVQNEKYIGDALLHLRTVILIQWVSG